MDEERSPRGQRVREGSDHPQKPIRQASTEAGGLGALRERRTRPHHVAASVRGERLREDQRVQLRIPLKPLSVRLLNHPFYPPPQFLSLAVTLLFLTHTPASALVPAYAAPALLRLRIFPPWLFLSSPSSISSRPITRFFAPSSCALPLVYARTLIGSFSSSSSSLCSYERQKYGNERDHQHTCYTPREVDRESACARASEGLRALY